MSRIATTVFGAVGVVLLAFAVGNISGFYFYPRLFTDAGGEHGEEDQQLHTEDDHLDEEHVALTKHAFENLGLELGELCQGEYWKSLTVPGEVIEVPGKSDLSVSAPVSGVVEEVMVLEGQALSPNDRLFGLRITDDNLVKAQSDLLAALSRQEVLRRESARLTPLVESGAVPGKRLIDLEYELSQLKSTQTILMQEIRARGLPDGVLREVVEDKSLADHLAILVPDFVRSQVHSSAQPVSIVIPNRAMEFSVEQLHVHPGKSVRRGDDLCDLAFHAELYIKGQAFESDLPTLARILEEDWTIRAEIGHEHSERHRHRMSVDGLKPLHVDNHVDRATQTFSFYLPLVNKVAKATVDERGRTFQQWLYKPGQRVHLQLPTEYWKDELLVPFDGVVVEGPNAFIFVEHIEDEVGNRPGVDDAHQHDDVFIELEPVPVRLLYRDNQMAVIKLDEQLVPGERVALNCAYKLHLAMKTQASGGGHHHHHDH